MALSRIGITLRDGARIRIRVNLDADSILDLRRKGLAVPQPMELDALLDPGAERSCIDPSVVSALALPTHAFNFTMAPGVGQSPLFGNASVNTPHPASVALLHPSGAEKDNLFLPFVVVQELSQHPLGIDAIIGRDVLASCVMVYDGPAGTVTLAY